MSWYNHVHRHSAIRYVTPVERHEGIDEQVLAARRQVYELAKAQNPQRWSGTTRNWDKYPEIFRKTWSTYKKVAFKKNQKSLGEF